MAASRSERGALVRESGGDEAGGGAPCAPPFFPLSPPRAGESWIEKVPGLATRLEAPRRRQTHGGIRGSMMEAWRRSELIGADGDEEAHDGAQEQPSDPASDGSMPSDPSAPSARSARLAPSGVVSLVDPDLLAGRAPLVPPLNFELVALGGLYRSGHPNERNFSFLRTLGLKSILYLGTEEYRANMRNFALAEGIEVFQVGLESNKEPFEEMDAGAVVRCLEIILDPRHAPLLVHCNKGKYRVGCVIGCLRKVQGWLHASIFEEYARWAGDRYADFEFIEVFDPSLVVSPSRQRLVTGQE